MVYGGCSTVFLKLIGDSLKEFASVDQFDTLLTVREISANGIDSILVNRKILPDEEYNRYINYEPLTPCGQ